MSEQARRRWRIDPETLGLVPEDGDQPRHFTAQELRAQVWPPCPVCGLRIQVDEVDVRTRADLFGVYVVGAWRCPDECDPRNVLRPA